MEKLHGTMGVYVKSVSKRREADDREKMLPIDVLAHAMIAHGEDFENDSVFGNCLISEFWVPLLLSLKIWTETDGMIQRWDRPMRRSGEYRIHMSRRLPRLGTSLWKGR